MLKFPSRQVLGLLTNIKLPTDLVDWTGLVKPYFHWWLVIVVSPTLGTNIPGIPVYLYCQQAATGQEYPQKAELQNIHIFNDIYK